MNIPLVTCQLVSDPNLGQIHRRWCIHHCQKFDSKDFASLNKLSNAHHWNFYWFSKIYGQYFQILQYLLNKILRHWSKKRIGREWTVHLNGQLLLFEVRFQPRPYAFWRLDSSLSPSWTVYFPLGPSTFTSTQKCLPITIWSKCAHLQSFELQPYPSLMKPASYPFSLLLSSRIYL